MKQKTSPIAGSIANRFAQAVAFHRNGHLPQACQFYETILSRQADHVDTLHMLGVARIQMGFPAEGVPLIERALQIAGPDGFMLSNLGNGLNKLGRHAEAVEVFTQALRIAPSAPETLNNLGIALASDGDHQQALIRFDEAVRIRPIFPECHNNRASSLRALGQAQAAIASCRQALRQRPNYAEALNNLGMSLLSMGCDDEALQQFNAAIKQQPDFLKALANRATIHRQRREYTLALEDYTRMLVLRPDQSDAHNGAGLARLELGQAEAALTHFDAALSLAPRNPALLSNRGNALRALQRIQEAIASFEQALEYAPQHADALNNLANLLLTSGQVRRALELTEQLCRIAPAMPEGHNNRGLAFAALGYAERAIAAFNEALKLRPGYASALCNRGRVLETLGRYGEALTDFDTAVTIQPDHVNARWNRALGALRLGRHAEAWADYEARWQLPGQSCPQLPMPRWQGEALNGRSILVWAEQGLGDTIQFCRYVPMLAARGARVFLQVPEPLTQLMRTLSLTTAVFGQCSDLPLTDFHCPIMSLPGFFGTHAGNIPATIPYLAATAEKLAEWQNRLAAPGTRRIGIACSGNARFAEDHDRSIPLRMFSSLMLPGTRWYLLQPECRPEDVDCLQTHPQIVDLRGQLRDFSDTAAVLAQMDLVISVDTAVAHLAGAMRRPLWLLLPRTTDWRWQIDRCDSPWYPGARLFRQTRSGDWTSVVASLETELTT